MPFKLVDSSVATNGTVVLAPGGYCLTAGHCNKSVLSFQFAQAKICFRLFSMLATHPSRFAFSSRFLLPSRRASCGDATWLCYDRWQRSTPEYAAADDDAGAGAANVRLASNRSQHLPDSTRSSGGVFKPATQHNHPRADWGTANGDNG